MKFSLAWILGWKLFSAPGSSKLLVSSSLAMALGLIPLVVVLSVADGMIEGISSRTIETALYHVQLWSSTGRASPADRASLQTALQALPSFRSLWPEQRGFALGYGVSGARLGLSVRGIDPGWAQGDPGAAQYLKTVSGTLAMNAPNSVWIGKEAAEKLGLKVGDELKLLTTRSQGSLTLPRVSPVRVAAIVSVGYQELDRLWLFVPLSLSGQLFESVDNPLFWGIKGDFRLDQTEAFTKEVRSAVGGKWQVINWQAAGRSQFLNYQATRALLAVVMGLVLLVAAFNVSTAMVTAVGERRRETAILKALGASSGLIRGQFLILGLGAGFLGTAVGLGGGMAIALAINPLVSLIDGVVSLFTGSFHLLSTAYYLETVPVRFDPAAIGGAAAGSLSLAVLASWLPALRASVSRPLDVLRRA